MGESSPLVRDGVATRVADAHPEDVRLAVPPLSLYVHLPWCVRKCPYCDFNSHPLRGELPVGEYVDALLADLEQDAALVEGRIVRTVFFGGGTPSLFPPAAIARLLAALRARLDCADNLEVTLEANPGTVEHGSFRDYRDAGVNRLSLGVQSFRRRHLIALGRIHDERAAHAAIEQAHAAGFDNFNIDLMYGLPGQDVEDAIADVRTACAHAPAHVSHYQLTLEPGTPFHRSPPVLPDEDACAAMQGATAAQLSEAGYAQYEVSAWARAGRECAHNLNYWTFGDYLGIGAGAHAKLTLGSSIRRTHKQRQPRAYLAAAHGAGRIEGEREVGPREAAFEFMLNALRLPAGFRTADFESRTGCPLALIGPIVAEAVARGLLEPAAGGWRPTALGLRFLNDLQALFLLEQPDPGVLAGSST
jgi:oxygen-independent coproporphyrinogen-3 oxidase